MLATEVKSANWSSGSTPLLHYADPGSSTGLMLPYLPGYDVLDSS